MSKRLSELLTLPGASPLGESLGQLRSTCAELDQFVHGLIDEMVALQDELDLRRQQLTDVWRDLESAKQSPGQASLSDTEVAAQFTLLESQRDELRRELEATNERMTKLANVAVGVAEAKAETAAARSELAALKSDLTESRAELAKERQRASADASDVERQLRLQVEELAREKSLVEVQLESVRDRAADLAAQVEDQQRRFAVERQQWHSQLGDLTRVVAVGARQPQPADTAPESVRQTSSPSRRTTTPRSEPERTSGNPMIDSVMAQFQMVQREAAKRRAKAS